MGHANGTIRVLIVDDHEMFAEALASFLEHQADEIETLGIASSVKAAVGRIEEARPDVVLLDGRLPTPKGPRPPPAGSRMRVPGHGS